MAKEQFASLKSLGGTKHTTYDDKTVKEKKKVTINEKLLNYNTESTKKR